MKNTISFMHHQDILDSTHSYPFTKELLVGPERVGDCLYPRSSGPVGTKSECASFARSCEAVCFESRTLRHGGSPAALLQHQMQQGAGPFQRVVVRPAHAEPHSMLATCRITANPRFKRRTRVEVSLVRRSRLSSNVACQVLKHNIANDQKRDLGDQLWRVLSVAHRA